MYVRNGFPTIDFVGTHSLAEKKKRPPFNGYQMREHFSRTHFFLRNRKTTLQPHRRLQQHTDNTENGGQKHHSRSYHGSIALCTGVCVSYVTMQHGLVQCLPPTNSPKVTGIVATSGVEQGYFTGTRVRLSQHPFSSFLNIFHLKHRDTCTRINSQSVQNFKITGKKQSGSINFATYPRQSSTMKYARQPTINWSRACTSRPQRQACQNKQTKSFSDDPRLVLPTQFSQ